MDAWLLNHPKYGATLRAWRENGTVPRKSKVVRIIMTFIKCSGHAVYQCTFWPVKIFTDVTMLAVADLAMATMSRPLIHVLKPQKLRTDRKRHDGI